MHLSPIRATLLLADEQTGETKRREAHAAADGVLCRVRLSERSCVGGLASVPRRRPRVRRATGTRVLLSWVRGSRIRGCLKKAIAPARAGRARDRDPKETAP